VREVFLSGTPHEAIEQAAQWRDQGARYVVVADASSLQRSLRKGLAAMIPFAKVTMSTK
jgi:phthiodiolone/phenolphthiodiolone dimycocerosates ketoreductase